ncbi:MAG: NAD(P)-binding domain-containing protein [Actinomycetaceae bacterium]|nr:NAD(P)-binding domain-containing protein [Arcanobacterium sp.]MDD7504569.1 NAD(P)-binding domain-containing protein [Actinomycetaceae bacterium]MDY6143212.1 NAD(P)-binding domain-containing protein [Arcanobacterium sp.]
MDRYFDSAVVVGYGYEGVALAEHAAHSGFPVAVTGRKTPEEIRRVLGLASRDAHRESQAFISPGRISAISLERVRDLPKHTVVLLAVPLEAALAMDAGLLVGRVVIDVTNYWAKAHRRSQANHVRHTHMQQPYEQPSGPAPKPRDTSLLIRDHFSQSTIVKTLNHIAHTDLALDSRPADAPARRGLAIASDDPASRTRVAAFVHDLGFTPVDAGPLENGRFFAPGSEIFQGGWRSAEQIARIIERRSGYRAEPYHLQAT